MPPALSCLSPRLRGALFGLLILSAGLGLPARAQSADPPPLRDPSGRALIKLIVFGDFRGLIAAEEGPVGSPGAARLAHRIKRLQEANPLHASISAGNLFGASPLRSARFKDEPTIEIMNNLLLDYAAVGHHELDEGKDELERLQNGRNHTSDLFSGSGRPGDLGGQGWFIGSHAMLLAGNLVDTRSGKPLFSGLHIKDFEVGKLAFIGMAARSSLKRLVPDSAAGLSILDEAGAINALVPKAQAEGARGIVVLAPQPVQTGPASDPCQGMSGPLVDLVAQLDPEIDLLLTAQSQQLFSCLLPNRIGRPLRVISSGALGRQLNEIDLALDPDTGDVAALNLHTHEIGPADPEDMDVQDIVRHYGALAAAQTSAGRMRPDQLGLVVNLDDPYSVEIAAYYAQRRGIPAANIVEVRLPQVPVLSRAAFEPLRQQIQQSLPPTVQGIAMVWRQPYAVDCLSITSVLTMGYGDGIKCDDLRTVEVRNELYRYTGGQPFTVKGLRPSMLLAAHSVASAKALIERGISADFSLPAAHKPGPKVYRLYTWDPARSSARYAGPARGPLDPWGTEAVYDHLASGYTPKPVSHVLIYQTGLTHMDGLGNIGWLPGALADHLTSYGGKLDSPPGSWQMSILDWIESGATASYGTVSEPYAISGKFPDPAAISDGYLGGYTALEAYWQSVLWPLQGVFVGEPLAAPYAPLLQRMPKPNP